jgi:hypothetical protein
MTTKREPAMVICCRMSHGGFGHPFDDNVIGTCARCGEQVYFRPHSPPFPKVCRECWEKERTPDDINIISPTVEQELEDIDLLEMLADLLRRRTTRT